MHYHLYGARGAGAATSGELLGLGGAADASQEDPTARGRSEASSNTGLRSKGLTKGLIRFNRSRKTEIPYTGKPGRLAGPSKVGGFLTRNALVGTGGPVTGIPTKDIVENCRKIC